MALDNTIRSGAVWQFAGNFGSLVLTFVFGIVLARLLAHEDFGILVTIQVFTGLAALVTGSGMGQSLIRAKEASTEDYASVFTLQLLIGCAIYITFFIAAPSFAVWYEQPIYTTLLRVSALSFLTRPFVNLPASLLHREMRFKALNVIKITTLLASSTISITLAWNGYGVWSLVLGGLTGSLCSMPFLALLSRWRPAFTMNVRRAGSLARYGMLVTANDFVVYLRAQTANFILGQTLGTAAVGLFNKADSLSQMPRTLVTSSVYGVLLRALAREQDQLDKSRYIFLRSICLVTVYLTPLCLGLAWLAEPLVHLLYGSKWIASAQPLAMFALAGPFAAIGTLSGAVLAARAWLQKELVVQLIVLTLTILGTIWSINLGLTGIAAVLLAVTIINTAQMYTLASRCIQVRWRQLFNALIPALILNSILFIALLPLQIYLAHVDAGNLARLVATTTVGGFIYSTAFLYLPINQLASEQLRWKRRLGLANNQN